MRVIIQRVSRASVRVKDSLKAAISNGLLVFAGIEDADNDEDIQWLSWKIINLRIFNDLNNIPNLSVKDVDGDILFVSQFTLLASTKKGNRPSYIKASKAEMAIPLYESLAIQLCKDLGKTIQTGVFGADMKMELINDGPVTIWMDSKNRE